jgi:hypothetical protein
MKKLPIVNDSLVCDGGSRLIPQWNWVLLILCVYFLHFRHANGFWSVLILGERGAATSTPVGKGALIRRFNDKKSTRRWRKGAQEGLECIHAKEKQKWWHQLHATLIQTKIYINHKPNIKIKFLSHHWISDNKNFETRSHLTISWQTFFIRVF